MLLLQKKQFHYKLEMLLLLNNSPLMEGSFGNIYSRNKEHVKVQVVYEITK